MHPDFVHEPEPYEESGEEFSAEPRVDDFLGQLEFNVDRLKQHKRGERVIYERCPIDFVAYIECISPATSIDSVLREVRESMQNLDLIVYLPIDNTIDAGDEEFPKLRKAVDRRLNAIYNEDDLGIISAAENLVIVEATGPIEKRLRTLHAAMKF